MDNFKKLEKIDDLISYLKKAKIDIKNDIVASAKFQLGDKVKRIKVDTVSEFYISIAWYDSDYNKVLYGIKRNLEDDIHTYSCLDDDALILYTTN